MVPVPTDPLPDNRAVQSTILVVDDEVLIRMAISDYLRDCGYKVVEAASGDEAMRVLENEPGIDLVFSDIQMPGGIDGFALALWARANRPRLRVMLTSGASQAAQTAKELCHEGPFVPKPYGHEDIERHIKALLGRAAS